METKKRYLNNSAKMRNIKRLLAHHTARGGSDITEQQNPPINRFTPTYHVEDGKKRMKQPNRKLATVMGGSVKQPKKSKDTSPLP